MTREMRYTWIKEVALAHQEDVCLLWPFSTRGGRKGDPNGAYPALIGTYGHIYLCTLVHGVKPSPKHEVEHICGNHLCMNPQHLAWATHKDNCARRTDHGTQLIGEKHNMVKLTEGQVWDIRHAAPVRGIGRELAKYYGVSPSTISLIRKGKLWKHIQ